MEMSKAPMLETDMPAAAATRGSLRKTAVVTARTNPTMAWAKNKGPIVGMFW